VAQRVREFGIRQALGADRHSILSLVLRQGVKTTAIGVVLGLAGSIVLARYLRSALQSVLFDVKPHDLSVFAVVTLALMAVAVVACYVPARRATRIDPIAALRDN
jgi:ABC-type antimicrobial peptide transport system permease subunit